MSLADRIRTILTSEDHEDGLTSLTLSLMLGSSRHSVSAALEGRQMPDAYVDRWIPNDSRSGRGPMSRVWCCVKVPEDCPRPTPRRRKKQAT
jgi:hypothetical protein